MNCVIRMKDYMSGDVVNDGLWLPPSVQRQTKLLKVNECDGCLSVCH